MIVQCVSGEERGWEGGCMCTRVVGVGGRVKENFEHECYQNGYEFFFNRIISRKVCMTCCHE